MNDCSKNRATPFGGGKKITAPNFFVRNYMLFLGAVFVFLYVVVDVMFDNFAFPFATDYLQIKAEKLYAGLDGRIARDFSSTIMWSALSKIVFLFPASIFISIYLAAKMPDHFFSALRVRISNWSNLQIVISTTLVVALLITFWSQIVFQAQPVYDDEYTYLFQASAMLEGQLVAQEPVCPECFSNTFVILNNGVWAGKYTSGHPALLALSTLLGSPYIITILLSSLIPFLFFLIGRELFDAKTGVIAAVLLTISPFFLFVTSTLMNHGTGLFFLLTFTFCYLRSDDRYRMYYPLIGGLALGVAFNIRPQSVVIFGAPFALWSLYKLIGSKRKQILLRHAFLLFSFLIPFVYALYYNKVVTGNYLLFPFFDSQNLASFPLSVFSGKNLSVPGQAFFKGLFFSFVNFWRMNIYLFGWGFSLVFVFLFFVMRAFSKSDILLASIVLANVIVYLFFPSPGLLEIGPRYYFPMLLPMMLWSARGMGCLHEYLAAKLKDQFSFFRRVVPVFIAVSVFFSVITFYREQAVHYQELSDSVAKPYSIIRNANIHNAIVMVRNLPAAGWVFGLRNNNPVLEKNDVIYIWATAPSNILQLSDSMPTRRIFSLYFKYNKRKYDPLLVEVSRDSIEKARDALKTSSTESEASLRQEREKAGDL